MLLVNKPHKRSTIDSYLGIGLTGLVLLQINSTRDSSIIVGILKEKPFKKKKHLLFSEKGSSNLDKKIGFTSQVSTLMKIKCCVVQENLCWNYKMDHNMFGNSWIYSYTPHKYLLTAHMLLRNLCWTATQIHHIQDIEERRIPSSD